MNKWINHIIVVCAVVIALGVAALNVGGFVKTDNQDTTLKEIKSLVRSSRTIGIENHELLVLVRCAFEPSLKGTPMTNREEGIAAIVACLKREGVDVAKLTGS